MQRWKEKVMNHFRGKLTPMNSSATNFWGGGYLYRCTALATAGKSWSLQDSTLSALTQKDLPFSSPPFSHRAACNSQMQTANSSQLSGNDELRFQMALTGNPSLPLSINYPPPFSYQKIQQCCLLPAPLSSLQSTPLENWLHSWIVK